MNESEQIITLRALEVASLRIEQLLYGPGGIMELKQTISDREAEIRLLEKELYAVDAYDSNLRDHLKGWK